MDRLSIGHLRGTDDRGDVEVALGRSRRTNANRFICQANILGVRIGFGVNDHRLDVELTTSPLDAQRNLTAVRDQDLVEQLAGGCVRHVSFQ